MLDTVKNAPVNGLDLAALGEVVEAIDKDNTKAIVGFDVVTQWKGQTRSETKVTGFTIAGERVQRSHTIVADEPVSVHREPVSTRLARWGRRHRTLASSLGVLLITAVAGLSKAPAHSPRRAARASASASP